MLTPGRSRHLRDIRLGQEPAPLHQQARAHPGWEIHVDGMPINDPKINTARVREEIGFVCQQFNLYRK
jgi:ABC-type phosphate transport system ATPase subunit